MKKFYTLFVVIILASVSVNAQLIDDDLEDYTIGPIINQSLSTWAVWSGNNNGPESLEISDAVAASGTQSGRVSAGPGPQDVMLVLGNIEEVGAYNLSFNMFIPAGRTGYFNIQGLTSASGGAGNGGNGVFNSPNLVFNNTQSPNGTGGLGGAYPNITQADPTYSWEYPEDAWFPVEILFEITADSALWTMTVNDVAIETQEFDEDRVVGAIDFFAIDANNEYFIDDVLFEDVTPVSTDNPILLGLKAYPNPVQDFFTITTSEQIDEITVYNLLGSAVLNTIPNSLSPVIDMSNLSSSMYLVEFRIGNDTRTIKVMK